MVNRRKFISRADQIFYKKDRDDLWKRQNGRCKYCKEYVERDKATFDHVISISKMAYMHSSNNGVMACKSCNKRKSNKAKVRFTRIEKLMIESMERLEKVIRRAEYNLDPKAHMSFKKWQKFHEKRGKWLTNGTI